MADQSKRRKGGLQQRLEEARVESERSSVVAEYLLQQYAWGLMSVQQVQQIAALVLQDMNFLKVSTDVVFPQLEALRKLESSGIHMNNMSRDIDKYVMTMQQLPPSTDFTIPTTRGEEKSQALLPHELFSYLYENHRAAFNKMLIPDGEDSLKKNWSQCSEARCLRDQSLHQGLKPDKAIPLACHGEEVPIAGRGKQWCKLSFCFSWYSDVAHAMPTRSGLLWIWASAPRYFVDGENGTLDHFMRVLSWSFDCLFSSVWPRSDYRGYNYPPKSFEAARAGKPLAGGFYGILLGMCGDADYFAKFLRMPHWASNTRPCGWCKCSKAGPLTWRDSRSNAPWRSTTFSPNDWLAQPDRSTCPIFDTQNVSGVSVQPDLMHVKYLGYQMFFLGSVLWLLVHELMPNTPLQNIKAVGLAVRSWQIRHHIGTKYPLHAFQKLSCFEKAKGYPKLKGKGSHIKHVVEAIGAVWKRWSNSADANHRRISLIFKLDAEVEDLLNGYTPSTGHYALPAEAANTVILKKTKLASCIASWRKTIQEQKFHSSMSYPRCIIATISTLIVLDCILICPGVGEARTLCKSHRLCCPAV